MIRIFIGYDPRQPVAFHVAAHSIMRRASTPVSITPLVLSQLPITRRGLTEFTYSRFLVPYLCGFNGRAIFVDSDMLCRGDIAEIAHLNLDAAAVAVVWHEQVFERPSVMVFDNTRCSVLTPEYVDTKSHQLFDLAWTHRASNIAALPPEWNHLVGYDAPNPDAKMVHFTKGVPCWPETSTCEFAAEWRAELLHLASTVSYQALMGTSVHAQPPQVVHA